MKLQGEAKIAKIGTNDSGTFAYLTLQTWGMEFQAGAPAGALKNAKEGDMVQIDGDVKFGRGKYGMNITLADGAVKVAKAG